jgi:hypothetical protein
MMLLQPNDPHCYFIKEKSMNASKLLVGSAAAVIAIGALSFAGCSTDRVRGSDTSSTSSYDNNRATARADSSTSDATLASNNNNNSGYQPAVNQDAANSLNQNRTTSSDYQSNNEPAPRATRG